MIEHAVKIANHRVPIIAGTGTNNTAAFHQSQSGSQSGRGRWLVAGDTLLQ